MSLDDFYLLGSGLLMTQTSIDVFNASLFSQLSPHSLLAWQRVRLANSLAHSGEEWAHIFSKYNSGQIMLDLSQDKPQRELRKLTKVGNKVWSPKGSKRSLGKSKNT